MPSINSDTKGSRPAGRALDTENGRKDTDVIVQRSCQAHRSMPSIKSHTKGSDPTMLDGSRGIENGRKDADAIDKGQLYHQPSPRDTRLENRCIDAAILPGKQEMLSEHPQLKLNNTWNFDWKVLWIVAALMISGISWMIAPFSRRRALNCCTTSSTGTKHSDDDYATLKKENATLKAEVESANDTNERIIRGTLKYPVLLELEEKNEALEKENETLKYENKALRKKNAMQQKYIDHIGGRWRNLERVQNLSRVRDVRREDLNYGWT